MQYQAYVNVSYPSLNMRLLGTYNTHQEAHDVLVAELNKRYPNKWEYAERSIPAQEQNRFHSTEPMAQFILARIEKLLSPRELLLAEIAAEEAAIARSTQRLAELVSKLAMMPLDS